MMPNGSKGGLDDMQLKDTDHTHSNEVEKLLVTDTDALRVQEAWWVMAAVLVLMLWAAGLSHISLRILERLSLISLLTPLSTVCSF